MLRWQKRKMREPLWEKTAAAFVLEMISMPKKLENGTRNPSVNLLKRLADGMGMALKIEFVPKQKK